MPINFNPNRRIEFANQQVGDGCPCFVTYEAGPTHNGVASAKELIRLAAEAGANAVKFQILNADRLVADKRQLFSYDILIDKESGKTETVEEPLYDILLRRQLSHSEWKDIKNFSDSLGLAFFATIGFEDELSLLEELYCDSVKIASADVNHWPLIRQASRTGMCIQLDTGNASIGEIEQAVDIIRKEGNERIIIHQCPSGYPARLPSINLRIIETLRQLFPYPIAYSDHTPGHDMDIAAVVLGANLVEKTITMDRTTRSIEHIFSLEPKEMVSFVQTIRDVETALGLPRRILHPPEIIKRDKIRRSLFLSAPVQAGMRLEDAPYEFRRPGYGITPDQFERLRDCRFRKDLPGGHMVRIFELEPPGDK